MNFLRYYTLGVSFWTLFHKSLGRVLFRDRARPHLVKRITDIF